MRNFCKISFLLILEFRLKLQNIPLLNKYIYWRLKLGKRKTWNKTLGTVLIIEVAKFGLVCLKLVYWIKEWWDEDLFLTFYSLFCKAQQDPINVAVHTDLYIIHHKHLYNIPYIFAYWLFTFGMIIFIDKVILRYIKVV